MAGARPRVLVAFPFADASAAQRLEAAADVIWGEGLASLDDSELVRGADGIILRPPAVADVRLFDMAPRLRVIGNVGTGVDHIDIREAEQRGIAVVSGAGGNANAVAEYAMAMAMAIAHRLFTARDAMRDEAFSWEARVLALRGEELFGRVLGVVGLGAIGQRVAQLATGIGIRVVAYDPYSGPSPRIAMLGSAAAVCEAASVLLVHAPLTSETRGLIGERELLALGYGGIVVNASRGGIVDEAALVALLREGYLTGAALDVLQEEPPSEERRAALARVPRLVVTPHIAGVTTQAGAALAAAAVDGVLAALKAGGRA